MEFITGSADLLNKGIRLSCYYNRVYNISCPLYSHATPILFHVIYSVVSGQYSYTISYSRTYGPRWFIGPWYTVCSRNNLNESYVYMYAYTHFFRDKLKFQKLKHEQFAQPNMHDLGLPAQTLWSFF